MDNPWRLLPTSPPYVLPEDAQALRTSGWTASKPEHELHFEALPEPFLGGPDAPVVLLNLNPGFRPEVLAYHRDPLFTEANRENLLHKPPGYPFYLLDPQLAETPGGRWWRRRVPSLIEAVGLQAVAQSVLCVEYFPYPSHRFGHSRLLLPSQEYGFHLVRQAIGRGALIIRLRSKRLWFRAVPDLASYRRLHRTRSIQNVSVSRRNTPTCFGEIFAMLGGLALGLATGHRQEYPMLPYYPRWTTRSFYDDP